MNDSNLLVRFISIGLAISSLMVVVLFATVIVVRFANGVRRARRKTLDARWRAIFLAPYTGMPLPEPLPAVGKRDWFTVLQLFEQFHELRERDRARAAGIVPVLEALAYRIGLDAYALGLLKKGDAGEKIVACNVLGGLRERRAFDGAARLSMDETPEISRAAAHCALRIDPEYIGRVLQLVSERDDWARPRVERMLREVDAARLDRAMRAALRTNDDQGRRRLLDYTRFCTPEAAGEICREVLGRRPQAETVAAALRSLAPLANDDDRDIALEHARSTETAVTLGALRVLRKCVRAEDEPLLQELTAHPDYWVRLRAAEVVVQFFGDSSRAEAFAARHPDRYARDAIRQALSETKRHEAHRNAADRRVPASAMVAHA